MITILTYDGSFEGFLTAVFQVYEEKIAHPSIQPAHLVAQNFFDTVTHVNTEDAKAIRIWKGMCKYGTSTSAHVTYRAFLSEQSGVENLLLYLIQRTFSEKTVIYKDYSDETILTIAKLVKKVGREKHRMDAFVRFQHTKDNLYFATIAPDFNVLPLLENHFKKRYADQCWLLYDINRNYGIYYNLIEVHTVQLETNPSLLKAKDQVIAFSEDEIAFQRLWKSYFQSTNIKERKNMKLHVQHVPRRYWKFLSEKSVS